MAPRHAPRLPSYRPLRRRAMPKVRTVSLRYSFMLFDRGPHDAMPVPELPIRRFGALLCRPDSKCCRIEIIKSRAQQA